MNDEAGGGAEESLILAIQYCVVSRAAQRGLISVKLTARSAFANLSMLSLGRTDGRGGVAVAAAVALELVLAGPGVTRCHLIRPTCKNLYIYKSHNCRSSQRGHLSGLMVVVALRPTNYVGVHSDTAIYYQYIYHPPIPAAAYTTNFQGPPLRWQNRLQHLQVYPVLVHVEYSCPDNEHQQPTAPPLPPTRPHQSFLNYEILSVRRREERVVEAAADYFHCRNHCLLCFASVPCTATGNNFSHSRLTVCTQFQAGWTFTVLQPSNSPPLYFVPVMSRGFEVLANTKQE